MDLLMTNCRMAPMNQGRLEYSSGRALAATDGKILWIRETASIDASTAAAAGRVIDCGNRWLLPGFIDCHTHLVWAGSRAEEFEARLKGESYESIAQKGGGILSTVRATREASEDELFARSQKRLEHFLKQGITTVEIKTGYGLDLDTELKMLRVIQRLKDVFPIHIEPTFLGAHTVPPEYRDDSQGYVDHVCEVMLPEVKKQGIATAVDVFCEKIAFTPAQTRQIFEAAKSLGFKIKLHAEQLSDSKGSSIAAELGALSCDHLEYLSESCAKKMAANHVAATLIPGAFYYLKQTRKPPVDLLRSLNIAMAVSTDLNPGTSPVCSMQSALNMACVLFGLTCAESLAGATIKGARALGLEMTKGSLETGKDADLALWDIDTPVDLCYQTGTAGPDLVVSGGKIRINHLD